MDRDMEYDSDESEQLNQIRRKLARVQKKAPIECSTDDDSSKSSSHRSNDLGNQSSCSTVDSQHDIAQIYDSGMWKSDRLSDDDMDEFAVDTNALFAILNGDVDDNNHVECKQKDEGFIDKRVESANTSMNKPEKLSVDDDGKHSSRKKLSNEVKHIESGINCDSGFQDSFYGVELTATPDDGNVEMSRVGTLLEDDSNSFGDCDLSSDSFLRAVMADLDSMPSRQTTPKTVFVDLGSPNLDSPRTDLNSSSDLNQKSNDAQNATYLSQQINTSIETVEVGCHKVDDSLINVEQGQGPVKCEAKQSEGSFGKDVNESQLPLSSGALKNSLAIPNCESVTKSKRDDRDKSTIYAAHVLPKVHLRDDRRSDAESHSGEDYTEVATLEQQSNESKLDPEYHSFSGQSGDFGSNDIYKNLEDSSDINSERCKTEIEPSLYAPTAKDCVQEPIVHMFTLQNKPIRSRFLLGVSELFPSPLDQIWCSKFQKFNQMQSELGNVLAYSDDKVIVTAPTGAGKTVVFEMAMARFFEEDMKHFAEKSCHQLKLSKCRKVIYLAPSKALCEERFQDWSVRLASIEAGIQIAIVTGDGDPSESFREITTAHLILTTPEKWDSVTRRWTENFILFSTVKLVLIDEVHLLADESRGSCLENVICRMKTIQRAASNIKHSNVDISALSYSNTKVDAILSPLRFIAVSATLPNIVDIASFIEANEAYAFDDSYRPVPLATHVIGQGTLGDRSSSHFHFWKSIDRGVPEVIRRYSSNLPSIIFCHSKLETENMSDALATAYNIGKRDNQSATTASKAKQARLQRVLLYGIAFHHAGLECEDRKLVEEAFRAGHVRVLCATSTLAMGVNLPAHLVVIKGTKAWRGSCNGYKDIDEATLLQMIGRAGRPGFDTSGTAVIMTDNESKSKYEKICKNGIGEAKSVIEHRLIESINVEISQRVITNFESAINWIKTTLYYVQLYRNPPMHGIRTISAFSIDAHLLRICKEAVHLLENIGAVKLKGDQDIIPRPGCHIMSQHLVDYRTMELIQKIPNTATQADILKAMSQIEGLHHPVRRSEKKMLNAAHKIIKMYKLDGPASKVRVQLPWEKAFVLLQVFIDRLELDLSYSLRQEMISIVEYTSRMLVALEEYSIHGSKNGNVIVQTLKLRRSLALRQWCAEDSQLQQIPGVSKALSFTLHIGGIATFADVLKHPETDLEKRANRPPPFGAEIRRACTALLQGKLQVQANLSSSDEHAESSTIHLLLEKKSLIDGTDACLFAKKGTSSNVRYTLLAFTEGERGCCFHRSDLTGPAEYNVSIPNAFTRIEIHLIASVIGLDEQLEIMREEKRKHGSVQTTSSLPASTFRRNIRDPNQCRPQITDRNLKGNWTLGNVNENITTPYLTVTPSPKTIIPTLSGHRTSNIVRNDRSLAQVKTSMTNRGSIISEEPYEVNLNGSQQRKILVHQESTPMRRTSDSSPALNNIVYHNTMIAASEHTGSNSWGVRNRWKRAKIEQTKVQRRAFISVRENPFSQYKHDPNDTESYLDTLTLRGRSQPRTTLIPEQSLYNGCDRHYRLGSSVRAPVTSSRAMLPKQFNSTGRLSNRDLLAVKANEAARNSISSQTQSYPHGSQMYGHPEPIMSQYDTSRNHTIFSHPIQSHPPWPQLPRGITPVFDTQNHYHASNYFQSHSFAQPMPMENDFQLGRYHEWKQRPFPHPSGYPESQRFVEEPAYRQAPLGTDDEYRGMTHMPSRVTHNFAILSQERRSMDLPEYQLDADETRYYDEAFF